MRIRRNRLAPISSHPLSSLLLFLILIHFADSFQSRTCRPWAQCPHRTLVVVPLSAKSNAFQQDDGNPLDRKFLERNQRWVVLVDDELAIRQAVGDYLYDQGYQVTACSDADAFLELCSQPLQQQPSATSKLPSIPDAIISDIRMPGKDGIQLLRLIRDDDRLSRVPVILLTAKGMVQDRIVGFKNELLSILDNLILRRKQMQKDTGEIDELKANMSEIKMLMKQNSENLVKDTDVYLTPVERQVLELLCKGFTNGEIANERNSSVSAMRSCITRLYQKTSTNTRTALVRWALQTGYVSR
ncbi:hypothetical protein MPSEU_001062900 [Mayamaea pseudoterrestris]|nr:hypothetical protein MPSEU_001062900 [Mayamaea pseudoterrestris]